ncbi:TIGR03936 family radical SAM-associated protein [Pelotomaculum terephthalicicum JT]|uniref:TIGR03936 family radical SAM-associated protein n=1 Tax=Pelotomaculum TaxID=191373 RepID=UPI0009D0C492|nr:MULTISPECIES: TIGR03936 family radical SAM-associated protein [Pelotomaculum]MCG9967005.1 TIGR03936 family radical SAM-associated protein [Pelotomaculum terephthalicicum JT]OPX89308.1 MAG: hypothetical protein A4E54_01019 [Pelotomaculum sp. PtaB.Bin117]OPY62622.1 MAG: hypothetical protein A4E56_01180 [Pelotomaculum sp. PtaU1.Bin065]
MTPSYRMQYSKKGPARYISHLDLLRSFERAGRRAGLPLAFSQGFNPHPKISFAAPLGVGTAGEAEYADIELTADLPAGEVFRALSGVLPEGLRLLEVRSIPDQSTSLMAAVDCATYRALANLSRPFGRKELDSVISSFMARPEIWAERKLKTGGKKKQNIRPGIFTLSGKSENDIIILEAELKAGSNGNVRFEEVLEALMETVDLPLKSGFVLSRTGVFTRFGEEKKALWQDY